MDDALVLRLLDAATRMQQRTNDQAEARSAAVVRRAAPAQWYSPDGVAQVAGDVAQVARAGSAVSAATTRAHLEQTLAAMDVQVQPSPTPPTQVPLRAGVKSYEEEYGRLAETYRYHRSIGAAPESAARATIARASAMLLMDLALIRREQSRLIFSVQGQVTGFRRIIRPYLSKGGTCGLCAVAADNTYGKRDLLPIHDRCKCTVLPITRRNDPGLKLNTEDLQHLYDVAGSTYGAALKEVRVAVEYHGELGPVLVNAAHRSKTPGLRKRMA